MGRSRGQFLLWKYQKVTDINNKLSYVPMFPFSI